MPPSTQFPSYPLPPEAREQVRKQDRAEVQRLREQGMSGRKARTQVWYDRHIGRFNR